MDPPRAGIWSGPGQAAALWDCSQEPPGGVQPSLPTSAHHRPEPPPPAPVTTEPSPPAPAPAP